MDYQVPLFKVGGILILKPLNQEELFFNLNPVNFFIISGLVQNLILSGILFFRHGNRPIANRMLSLTLMIVSLHLAYLMILDTNLDNMSPYLLWIPFSYLTALGPLIYFYAKALTNISFGWSKKSFWHFIPVTIETALQIFNIVYCIKHDQLFYNTPFYFYMAPMLYVWTAGSLLYYLNLSLGVIKSHENWALENFSNLKEITLVWLHKLIVHYRLLWMIWVPFVTIFLLFFRFQLQYLGIVLTLYLLLLAMTYLTFWIGLQGLVHANAITLKRNTRPRDNKNFGHLSQSQIQAYVKGFEALMSRDKAYLDENLSLTEFASLLNLDSNLVSYILNNHLKSNFHDFVNQYRIKEVKKRLTDPAYDNITLLGIALDSGFNSKTTFNRVFKKITGITPTEFQKMGKQDSTE
ncbi:helix-turn-helix domain-containing protein [Flagellimonas sp.]|uniref:helix-turn-helix domain-containing protein n=1 Tax=Flagellimonas sp. TaxID=2058762 RepID=UPI003B51C3E0